MLRGAGMFGKLALMLAATLVIGACGQSGGKAAEGEMALGAAEGAKVTVVEYASVTCSACAAWNETVWPAFKAKYVDSGKVRYIFREYPTPPADVAAAGFLMARCAGPDAYFPTIDAIMRSQVEWRNGVAPRDSLIRIAAAHGMDEQAFMACVTDEQAIKALETRTAAARAAGVTGTPAFFINDQQVQGRSLDELSAVIDPLLGAP
ncbi:MAG: DsbA family protein [Brevundimonas sp.]|uniref:DsbA family protein n=1 Tax=Brevundimonas sp. TaxID=1871086 RepID=UPI00271C0F46|nr:DsbA family protein [Brevundimonas sp.]MDO9608344.1 DsbA family protein [Brevundimonas sp.]